MAIRLVRFPWASIRKVYYVMRFPWFYGPSIRRIAGGIVVQWLDWSLYLVWKVS